MRVAYVRVQEFPRGCAHGHTFGALFQHLWAGGRPGRAPEMDEDLSFFVMNNMGILHAWAPAEIFVRGQAIKLKSTPIRRKGPHKAKRPPTWKTI